MATDSTELTFVRCPSCRSLVPAVSTRCRMCGATLEAGAKGAAEEADKKQSGRVRQRTMSNPQGEMKSAISRLRSEIGDDDSEGQNVEIPAVDEPGVQLFPSMQEGESTPAARTSSGVGDDPLSAYIEEVSLSEESRAASPSTAEMSALKPMTVALDPIVTVSAPSPASAKAESSSTIEKVIVVETKKVIEPLVSHDEDSISEAPASLRAPEPERPRTPQTTMEDGPRVIVETGSRRGKGGLSFGRPRDTAPTPPAAGAPSTPSAEPRVASESRETRNPDNRPHVHQAKSQREDQGRREQQHARPQQGSTPERSTPERSTPERSTPERSTPERSAPERSGAERAGSERGSPERVSTEKDRSAQNEHARRAAPDEVVAREHGSPAVTPFGRDARPQEKTRRAEGSGGRLFGWLVSYSLSTGNAIEIREGKFFVSSQSLKPSDLVIADSSVSMPHALVNASLDQGLVVQDLMSERGVFVRQREQGNYMRIEESANLEHGDWIRFGDVEFLVSLVPYVGVK